MSEKFQKAIERIDSENANDASTEVHHGKTYPKELLYSQRMTAQLLTFHPQASEALQIATRAQHINRWKIPRDNYSMDRVGYLKWREELKKMHAKLTSEILQSIGYDAEFIDRVAFLIQKKKIKRDEESQTLEDVICLVFLKYYFEEFSLKHDDEKLIGIIRKTWKKMSDKGREHALLLSYSDANLALIKEAIS